MEITMTHFDNTDFNLAGTNLSFIQAIEQGRFPLVTSAPTNITPYIVNTIVSAFPYMDQSRSRYLFALAMNEMLSNGSAHRYSWDAFASHIWNFIGTNAPPGLGASPIGYEVFRYNLYIAFVQEFSQLALPEADWNILNTNSSIQDVNDPNNLFLSSFLHFINQYQPNTINIADTVSDFFTGFIPQFYLATSQDMINKFRQFYTTNTTLQIPGTVPLFNPAVGDTAPLYNNMNFPSYEAIYYALRPTNPPDTGRAGFIADLQQFYQQEKQTYGYFLPSHSFGRWIEAMRDKFNVPVSTVNNNLEAISLGGPSSLAGNSSEKVFVIHRIIALLIAMIGTLQNVAIVQANRLKYITQYQQVYTGMQSQIPVFLEKTNDPAHYVIERKGMSGVSSTDQARARTDLNSSYNALLTDNLRSLRSIQEDKAKQIQSNINQTNDAVNQQTDMATSFIQQLSTLLSTIMR
jgi:hypothetical protein